MGAGGPDRKCPVRERLLVVHRRLRFNIIFQTQKQKKENVFVLSNAANFVCVRVCFAGVSVDKCRFFFGVCAVVRNDCVQGEPVSRYHPKL